MRTNQLWRGSLLNSANERQLTIFPSRKKVLQDTRIEVCMAFLFLDSLSLAATSGNLNYLAHCISGRGNSVPRCCVGQDKLCLSPSVSFKCLVLAVKAWCGGAVTFLFVVFQGPRLQRRSCTSITQPTRIIYQSQSKIN